MRGRRFSPLQPRHSPLRAECHDHFPARPVSRGRHSVGDAIDRLGGPFGDRVPHLLGNDAGVAQGLSRPLVAFAAAGAALCTLTPWPMAPFLVGNAVLAMGYTVPPLKLWARTGGVDVCADAQLFRPGGWRLGPGRTAGSGLPWLIGLPLFWAVLAAIVLSGIPDFDADRASGKHSLAVRFGPRRSNVGRRMATPLAAITSPFTWLPALGAGAAPAIAVAFLCAALQIVRLETFGHRERGRAASTA